MSLTIVIPVHNESQILIPQILRYLKLLKSHKIKAKFILSENGSQDKTKEICKILSNKFKNISYISTNSPNYGLALKKGIIKSRSELILCDEIDICNINFLKRGIFLIKNKKFDFVIGSKNLRKKLDNRPITRKLATTFLNYMLRILFNFKGTDTHGIKIFNRKKIISIVKNTLLDKDMFTTELVINCQKKKIRYKEIPIRIKEIRDTPISLYKRVPKVIMQLFKLFFLRIRISDQND
jgi:hypothetical protein